MWGLVRAMQWWQKAARVNDPVVKVRNSEKITRHGASNSVMSLVRQENRTELALLESIPRNFSRKSIVQWHNCQLVFSFCRLHSRDRLGRQACMHRYAVMSPSHLQRKLPTNLLWSTSQRVNNPLPSNFISNHSAGHFWLPLRAWPDLKIYR